MPHHPPSWNTLALGLVITLVSAIMAGGCAPNAITYNYEQPSSLQCEDLGRPKLISGAAHLSVWSYQGRLYVFGSEAAGRAFEAAPHAGAGLVDAGAGPTGEDVVFARADAAHPRFTDELRERYRRTPKLLRRAGRAYSLWQREDRLFVLGPNTPVEEEFVRSGELTIAKTFFDAGPKGETVVVEASKGKNQFADLLMERYLARPLLIDKRCPDYFAWKENGHVIVLGSAESSLRLETGGWLPETRAFIGVGPQGETVAFETDSRRPELLRRLATRYFGEGKVPAGVMTD